MATLAPYSQIHAIELSRERPRGDDVNKRTRTWERPILKRGNVNYRARSEDRSKCYDATIKEAQKEPEAKAKAFIKSGASFQPFEPSKVTMAKWGKQEESGNDPDKSCT